MKKPSIPWTGLGVNNRALTKKTEHLWHMRVTPMGWRGTRGRIRLQDAFFNIFFDLQGFSLILC